MVFAFFYSGGRVWAEPTKKQSIQGLKNHTKKRNKMYKHSRYGYTINTKDEATVN